MMQATTLDNHVIYILRSLFPRCPKTVCLYYSYQCEPVDLDVDMNLVSLWDVSNIHTAFEKKENANERGKRVKGRARFGREKTSKLFSVAQGELQSLLCKKGKKKSGHLETMLFFDQTYDREIKMINLGFM